jgi:hypothetical protein
MFSKIKVSFGHGLIAIDSVFIFCKVNNLDYHEVLEKRDDIKITVEQVEKVINEAIKVGIKIDSKI